MNGYFIDWQTGMAIVIALTLSVFSIGFLLLQQIKLDNYCFRLENEIKRLKE